MANGVRCLHLAVPRPLVACPDQHRVQDPDEECGVTCWASAIQADYYLVSQDGAVLADGVIMALDSLSCHLVQRRWIGLHFAARIYSRVLAQSFQYSVSYALAH